ncbi:cupin 2 domain-containing protein [Caballeronia udeis]|uniref:Cupin 2 domain-containing protein n=1 Tax=Caballeronia udeis TaxID=1232866 RepID=A0A158GXV9_9BURK|nr:cupin domain-containing protein [Caballeronia udeis]SAL37004.1 cupin 2 domain-containing protein [Caballeronia udeis]
MAKWKRYVVGPDQNGKSAVLMEEATNVQEQPGIFYRVTLWSTREVPVDNTITTDRGNETSTREPFPGGLLFRALEIPPDTDDKDKHIETLRKLNVEVKQKHPPTEEDLARHPSMHRTDTLDCLTCIKGEIYLVTDVDEALMRPGDSVVIRGTNHAWSNRSGKPCLLVGCMIDATR